MKGPHATIPDPFTAVFFHCPYCSHILQVTADPARDARIREEALEEAARAAGDAQLPEGYQWGEEATEHFNFGKARAAAAIRALIRSEPE